MLANEVAAQKLRRVILDETNWVFTQNPVVLRDSMPEPDIMVSRETALHYQGRLPGAADILLIIEVSDSTLLRDRTLK